MTRCRVDNQNACLLKLSKTDTMMYANNKINFNKVRMRSNSPQKNQETLIQWLKTLKGKSLLNQVYLTPYNQRLFQANLINSSHISKAVKPQQLFLSTNDLLPWQMCTTLQ